MNSTVSAKRSCGTAAWRRTAFLLSAFLIAAVCGCYDPYGTGMGGFSNPFKSAAADQSYSATGPTATPQYPNEQYLGAERPEY